MNTCPYHECTVLDITKNLTKLSKEKDALEIDLNYKISILTKRIEQLEKLLPKE
jgi:hypothetical protein